MALNPLPPQAYTKDTLVKAYNWLAHQSPHIKELATTTDVMVSLFLKAQRDGLSSLENPSIQNFKNELKTLSSMLGNFDIDISKEEAQKEHQTVTKKEPAAEPQKVLPQKSTIPSASLPLLDTSKAEQTPSTPSENTSSLSRENSKKPEIESSSQTDYDLDSKSILMIQEIKTTYNLSSDKEALRMLIKIGYIKAINMYKSI